MLELEIGKLKGEIAQFRSKIDDVSELNDDLAVKYKVIYAHLCF